MVGAVKSGIGEPRSIERSRCSRKGWYSGSFLVTPSLSLKEIPPYDYKVYSVGECKSNSLE